MAPSATSAMIDQRSLMFRLGHENYSMNADRIVEVIRAPVITRVPNGPSALIGIANLRGKALPVVSLGKLSDIAASPTGGNGKVIVYDRGELIGLLVDDILKFGSVRGSERRIDPDADGWLENVFKVGRLRSQKPRDAETSSTGPISQIAATYRTFLSFRLSTQTYALPLESVHEVIAPAAGAPLAEGSGDVMLGVIALRDGLLPIVSLAGLLGLKSASPDATGARIVVVDHEGASLGLMVDRIDAIRRLPVEAIDPVPAVLKRGNGPAEIESIGRIDNGRTLISILSAQKLFGNDAVDQTIARTGGTTSMSSVGHGSVDEERFLIFALGDETYGLPIGAVDEVIRVPDTITRMPNAPAFITGVINLRGKAVPLIDQRIRFDAPAATRAGKARAVILTIDRLQAGFVVDAVSEIIAIPTTALSAAPEFSSDQSDVFDRVAHIETDGRMILLIDPRELLSRAERDVVASYTDAKPSASGS